MAQINQYLDGARVTFPTPFLPTGLAPLDIRQIVESKSKLNIDSFKHNGNPYWYQGMLVSCLEDHKVYILKKKGENDFVFEEVTPDLPENATKNTTYELSSGDNTAKGVIKLHDNDENTDDIVYVEGDSTNIKVSSTKAGVKVEHTAATSGDALTSSETLTPGYSGTFTAVTGLTKDANGHIVAAELKTITLPGEQTIPAETFTGVQVEGVDLTIANTKVNWGLNYNSSNKHIEVVDRNNSNAVMDYIDASDFIKDGMLSGGELVWCTIKDGEHAEVPEGTEGAVHCLKLTLHVWEHGQVDENGDPIYTVQYVHIPLGELCDPYAGTTGEIDVVEEHGQHVISLATKTVSETTGTALTPAHGGSFNVVTDVTYDTKGRIAGVETTQVTLPECAEIGDGTQTGSDDYVSVTVSTTGGVVSEVTVNTDSLTEKIEEIETVTSAALNDLNVRVSGIEAEYVKAVTSEEEALNNSSYVSVHAATEDGRVTLTSTVEAVDATDTTKYPSTGLATDGYVKEQIASVSAVSGTAVQNITSTGLTITVERQAGSNDVNLELMWASF